jgi:MGT family glycosyltransferase
MPSLAEMGVVPLQGPGTRRFLFVVPPLAGHAAPLVALAAELAGRGHQVAWAGHPAGAAPLLTPRARLFPTRVTARLGRARVAWLSLRGPAALRSLWEDLIIPVGHAMVPGIETAVEQFRPDVIVTDRRTPAGAVVALRHGLRWVTSAGTSAAFAPSLPGLPRADEWVGARLAEFQRAHGVSDPVDLRFSGHTVLGFCAAGLVGDTGRFPAHYTFVGPVPARPAPGDPGERAEGPAPQVLVSLGAAHGPAEERFARIAADAVGRLGLRAVVTSPFPAVPGTPPPNEQAPPAELLPHLAAVVTHGDHDTVCAALAHGIPLVVAPVRDEQPVIAGQVAAAGAGIAIRFARVQADELSKALTAVLSDEGYRSAAGRIRSSLAAAGGVAEAADRLDKPE